MAIYALRIAVVAIAYAATGWLGLSIPYAGSNVALVCPAAGIGIAALLRWGPWASPGVAAGAFLASLVAGAPAPVALAMAAGNTAGPLLVATALRWLEFQPRFERHRDVLWFGLISLIGMMVPATGSVLALVMTDAIADPAGAWLAGWLGDTASALALAPVLLTVPDALRTPLPRRPGRVLELVAVVALTVGVTGAIFAGDVRLPVTFAMQAPLGWAALRLRTWATTTIALAISVVAVVATALGRGPFIIGTRSTHVLLLAGFVATASLLTLVVRSVLAERDTATGELSASGRRLQAALAAGSMGTWTWHIARDRLVWDDSAARLCERGQPGSETPLAELLGMVHAQDRASVADALARARRGDSDYDVEHRIVRPDGQVRWLVARGRLEPDGSGGASIAIVAIDVTDRRVGEQRQRAAERAAVETEARMGAIVSAAIDAIITVDAEGRVVVFNAAAERMFRRAAGDVLGHRVAEIVPRDHRDDPGGWLGRLIPAAGEDADARPWTPITVSAVRADGVSIPLEASVSQVGSGAGRLVTIILRDVSERMRAETERERLETQLRQAQKMEAIGTLAGGIAHDFNNLLAALLGNAELVQMDLPVGHPAREAVDDIVTVGHRARDLVSQILAFGRRGASDRHLVRIDRVVTEAARLLRASLPDGVDLVTTVPGSGATVLGDAAQLHQVLLNLCTNAAQAMPGRGGRIDVTLDVVDVDDALARSIVGLVPGPHVRLTVCDDGVGMDAATRERIFEPFFTTKPPGQGTGLGLAVVHGIVKSHGGALAVETAPGLGTAVHVYLPAAPVAADPTAPRPAPVTPGGRGEHVLWIDDEPAVASVSKRRLERLGYRVTTLTSSAAALDLLRASPEGFDLVITDLTMPVLSGIDLAAHLAASRPGLPVILSTGNTSNVPDPAALPANIREVLQKPMSEPALAAAVRRALANRTVT